MGRVEEEYLCAYAATVNVKRILTGDAGVAFSHLQLHREVERAVFEGLTAEAVNSFTVAPRKVASENQKFALVDDRGMSPSLVWMARLSLLKYPLQFLEFSALLTNLHSLLNILLWRDHCFVAFHRE
jgi:hypothetical protein